MRVFGISFNSLPVVFFAHSYSSSKYDMSFEGRQNILEISYLIEGDTYLEYNNTRELIPAGSVIISPCIDKERHYCEGMHSHMTMAFSVDTTGGDISLPNHAIFEGRNYRKDIAKIVEEFTAFQVTTVRLQAMVLKLVADLADDWKKSQRSKKSYAEPLYIEKAKRYIAAHLHEKIYVEDVAQAVGLSSGYLSNIFRHHTTQTLVEYINRTKLTQIKDRMDNYHITLKEAALEFGYADLCYISRIYKKYFGQNISGKGLTQMTDEILAKQ